MNINEEEIFFEVNGEKHMLKIECSKCGKFEVKNLHSPHCPKCGKVLIDDGDKNKDKNNDVIMFGHSGRDSRGSRYR